MKFKASRTDLKDMVIDDKTEIHDELLVELENQILSDFASPEVKKTTSTTNLDICSFEILKLKPKPTPIASADSLQTLQNRLKPSWILGDDLTGPSSIVRNSPDVKKTLGLK